MSKRNDRNENLIGSGNLKAAIVETLALGDNNCINIGSSFNSYPSADPRKQIKKQTIQIDNDGGSSELRIILRRYVYDADGDILTGTKTVTIDGTDYTATSGVITHNIDGNTYDTLHDLVAAINALPGFVATITDALTTLDTGTDAFIDVAEVAIPSVKNGGMDTLANDVSETAIVYKRIGLPRVRDKNPLQLLEIRGSSTGITNGTVQLIRDNDDEYVAGGAHQEVYVDKTLVAAQTHYVDRTVENGDIIRGSVVLKVESDNLSAADFAVKFRQALAD